MFRAIVSAALGNRLMVLALSAALVIAGLLAVRALPVDVFPDLNRATVTVMTEGPALAAEEVEALVTVPVEQALNGMPGIIRLRSASTAGLSIVYADFDFGGDVLANRQQVAERLSAAETGLPAGVVPHMTPVSSIMGEVMLVAVTGSRSDPLDLRELADFTLRPKLLGIPGVAQVTAIGGGQRQYVVSPRADAMRAFGVTLAQIEAAAGGFASNAGGGFVETAGREVNLRAVTRTIDPAELARLTVATVNGAPVRLDQVADVRFQARPRRGDAGYEGQAAVMLSVAKQPGTDTIALTRRVEAALADLQRTVPAGVRVNQVQFRQADFVETSLWNVERVLLEALLVVAVVLYAFLRNWRSTGISLVAIPLSVLVAALVFRMLGLSINTMTLGGIAIAVGELVDDAVVDVENILRRLRENRQAAAPRPVLAVVADASQEVRSGIVYATAIIILVMLPLLFLGGLEGQLFRPLALSYVVAILASLLVSITVTPVLASLLLQSRTLEDRDSRPVAWLKQRYAVALGWAFRRGRAVLAAAGVLVAAGTVGAMLLPRTFLPPFNEGSFTVNLLFQPGISLTESARLGSEAERLVMGIAGVQSVGRRTGRGELDEHAEGVHYGELDVRMKAGGERPKEAVAADIRAALAPIPAAVNLGQPIGHRLDHMVSGVRAEIAVKLYGEDLDRMRRIAAGIEARMNAVPGLVDVQVERIVRVPQLDIRVRPDAAAAYGVTPAQVAEAAAALTGGRTVGTVVDGSRRFDVVVRLADAERTPAALGTLAVDTPQGPVQLGVLADIEEVDAPNQYSRENGRRRLAVLANTDGSAAQQQVAAAVEAIVADTRLPLGASATVEGTFQAQRESARTLGLMSLVSLSLIFALLYSRYRSASLALIVIGSIPLALAGSVAALWLAGQPLSVASMIGFITLGGIAARNGILKISHWLNLHLREGVPLGEELIARGALDRLTPVLLTALSAALALTPLMLAADAPGREILHPVAITIFGGLVTSTLLDAFVTPLLFRRFGPNAVERLRAHEAARGLPTAATAADHY